MLIKLSYLLNLSMLYIIKKISISFIKYMRKKNSNTNKNKKKSSN